MRCQTDAGVLDAGYVRTMLGLEPVDFAAPEPQADNDSLPPRAPREFGRPDVRRLGKLMAFRPKPRRLDARVVKRRPMMLVKRRPWCALPVGLLTGREIIARS